jgi:uncharacterized protein DUF4145
VVEAVAEEAVFRGRLRWQHTDAPPTGRWRPAVSVRGSTEPSREDFLHRIKPPAFGWRDVLRAAPLGAVLGRPPPVRHVTQLTGRGRPQYHALHVRSTHRYTSGRRNTFSLRCPACHQQGTFKEPEGYDLYSEDQNVCLGSRYCPNPACGAHIFTVARGNELLATYPPERIDFDATNLPLPVLSALEEAITCHAAGCFRAAAIMIRKTLEELCADRGAKGKDLKQRIAALGTQVLVPPALLEGPTSCGCLVMTPLTSNPKPTTTSGLMRSKPASSSPKSC